MGSHCVLFSAPPPPLPQCLSAAAPPLGMNAEEWSGDPRRSLWATLLLEGGSFTMQAHSMLLSNLHMFFPPEKGAAGGAEEEGGADAVAEVAAAGVTGAGRSMKGAAATGSSSASGTPPLSIRAPLPSAVPFPSALAPQLLLRQVGTEDDVRLGAEAAYSRMQTYFAEVAALEEREAALEAQLESAASRGGGSGGGSLGRGQRGNPVSPPQQLRLAIGHLNPQPPSVPVKRHHAVDQGIAPEQLVPFFLGDAERTAAAWAHLVHSGANEPNPHTLSREEFITACCRMYAAFSSVKRSLDSNESLSSAIRALAAGVFWVVMLLVGLGIYGVDFSTVLVCVGGRAKGQSLHPIPPSRTQLTHMYTPALELQALPHPYCFPRLCARPLYTALFRCACWSGVWDSRSTTQRHVFSLCASHCLHEQSLVFTLFMSPYDPGDKITIDNGPTLSVKSMNLLTSEFTVLSSNLHLTRRNSDLLGSAIVNLRKSQRASFSIVFSLDHRATVEDLAFIERRVQRFLARDKGKWVPGSASLSAGHAEQNRVEISLSVQSHLNWMEGGKVSLSQRALVMELVAALKDLGVEYAAESLRLPRPGVVAAAAVAAAVGGAGAAAAETATAAGGRPPRHALPGMSTIKE